MPDSESTPSTLADLQVGDSAIVEKVGCARVTSVRLMEMGLLPGSEVSLKRIAPLGDPLELSVSGYSLSIRRAEAKAVGVGRIKRAEEARTAREVAAVVVGAPEGADAE